MIRSLLAAAALSLAVAAAPPPEDPYLWLEEIEGERALTQVKKWNAETSQQLEAMPGFEEYRARARAILDDEQQIPLPEDVLGDHVTNLWRDAEHPRGIWRISPLDVYVAGKPEWRTLIDVDALGREEDKSWVWHGADCLAPEYRRCLVSLSPGGTDADVVREFDLQTGKFVDGGFTLPEAKSNVAWIDRDNLIVVTDYGPESLTKSGYGRVAKIWRRGTPLAQAKTLFTGEVEDVSVYPVTRFDDERAWTFVSRGKTFWESETHLLVDGKLVRTPLPETAEFQGVIDGRMVASLNEALGPLPAGAVVAYSLADIAAGRSPVPQLVFAPSRSQAVEQVAASDNLLWVKLLDDVSGKLVALAPLADGKWAQQAISLPANSTIQLQGTAGKRDMALATVEGFLTPPALYAVKRGEAPRMVQALPPKFDADLYAVEQRFATSKDGTRIPYFLVRKKTDSEDPVPVLIHAYGGFRAAQTPTYLTGQPYRAGPLGLFWVESGNAFVLANIRGGGEYGPAWHEAALKENRQRSFDDLHAVAEHLIETGVTAKGGIGISGRSNGGVLVGAAITQRPDLYSAVISGSPLHDMKRYSHLLAGASWIGEYGDPDKPEEWAYISRYSPYQNVREGVRYPPVFFYSSTKDDRVHPGHARKLAARLEEYGNRIYFHEYLEGGHSVGADHAEDAYRAALLQAFLTKELVDK